MRRLVLLVTAVGLAACGSSSGADFSSPVTACQAFANAVCTVESNCNPGTVIIDSCTQLLEGRTGCDQAGCPVGTTYSPTGAQACYNAYLAQNCSDSNNDVTPALCDQTLLCVAD